MHGISGHSATTVKRPALTRVMRQLASAERLYAGTTLSLPAALCRAGAVHDSVTWHFVNAETSRLWHCDVRCAEGRVGRDRVLSMLNTMIHRETKGTTG